MDYVDAGNPTRYNANAWNRIALVVDAMSPSGSQTNTVYRSHVNGVLQNVVASPAGWGSSFFLFADEDRETTSGAINSLQIRDYAMTDAEIAALGGPTANGIGAAAPEPATGALLRLALPVVRRLRRRD